MAILDEIIEDPELIKKLCDFASSMSLALACLKLQEQQKEITDLKVKLTDLREDHRQTREKLDKVAAFVKDKFKKSAQ